MCNTCTSGRVIETFVFGIVKVCENGKMVLKRRTDINGDVKIGNVDTRGKNNVTLDKVKKHTEQIVRGEARCIVTEIWSW